MTSTTGPVDALGVRMSVPTRFDTTTVSEAAQSGPAWDGDLTAQDLWRNFSYLCAVLSELDGAESSHGY